MIRVLLMARRSEHLGALENRAGDAGFAFRSMLDFDEARRVVLQDRFDGALLHDDLGFQTAAVLIPDLIASEPNLNLVVLDRDPDGESAVTLRRLGAAEVYGPGELDQAFSALSHEAGSLEPRLTRFGSVSSEEIQVLERILEASGSSIRSRWLLGFAWYRAGQHERADPLLDEVVARDATDCRALYYLAACRFQQGRHPEAIQLWRRVQYLDPDSRFAIRARQHVDRFLGA